MAILYLFIVPIEGVGGPWTLEGGDLGDLGGLGIANEDVHMCGGGTCGSELWLTLLVPGVHLKVPESFAVLFSPLVHS